MIWHLLWLYPLIGLGLGIYYRKQYLKHDDDDLLVAMACTMGVIWPVGWYFCARDIRDYKAEAVKREEKEHEALLESIRRERYAPDPRLAEFDKELGIEPEPRKFSWETVVDDSWELMSYANGGCGKGHYTDAEGVMYRVRHITDGYAKGGIIPPTKKEFYFED